MQPGLYQAAASMDALSRAQDTLTFNLAQTGVVGFKRHVTTLGSFEKQLRLAGAEVPMPQANQSIDFSQGALLATGNPLDLAIKDSAPDSHGFFKIETPQGIRYTRGGSFFLTPEGALVNVNGDRLVTEGGSLDARQALEVDESGNISQGGRATNVKITMVGLSDPKAIVPEGSFRLKADPSLERASTAVVKSKFLEQSNSDPVDSLLGLITVSRAFEMSARAIRTMDEALQRTTTSA